MADSYDLSTLLPISTLRQITQHYGCPSFFDPDGYGNAYDEDRNWSLYLFSGRVPSPAEFYYGLYIDREGDSHTTKPLTLQEKLVGRLAIKNNADLRSTHAVVGHNLRVHGAVWPNGAAFAQRGQNLSMVRAEPLPYAGDNWVLDWAFDNNYTYTLTDSDLSALRNWHRYGYWVGPARPTWFWLTSHDGPFPECVTTYVTSRDSRTDYKAVVQRLKDTSPIRRPLLLGTAGPIGSGADLQLANGGDGFNANVNLISLRVVLNETA